MRWTRSTRGISRATPTRVIQLRIATRSRWPLKGLDGNKEVPNIGPAGGVQVEVVGTPPPVTGTVTANQAHAQR